MLSLSLKWHHPRSNSVYVWYVNGFQFGSLLTHFRFGNSGCTFQFKEQFFFTSFLMFPNFPLQIYS